MADIDLSMPIVKTFAALVELSNRIKDRADYEVVMAAFKDLDDDSNMATNININVTKITADAGGQLGKESFDQAHSHDLCPQLCCLADALWPRPRVWLFGQH
jgi:hypothetical protein